MLARRARRQEASDPSFPALWILCGGRPNTVIESSALAVREGGSAGLYPGVPGLRLNLVVLAELPRTRDTLLLRLMGAGRTLHAAIAEVMALPASAWEKSVAEPWLIRLQFEIPPDASARTVEEEQLFVEIQKWCGELKRGMRQEGKLEGKLEVLAGFFATRLGRPLSEAKQAVLAERARRLSDERLRSVVLANDGAVVAVWLADPAAS